MRQVGEKKFIVFQLHNYRSEIVTFALNVVVVGVVFFLYFSGNLIVKQTAEKEEEGKKCIKRIIVKNDD